LRGKAVVLLAALFLRFGGIVIVEGSTLT
jgi:hypothetical protein